MKKLPESKRRRIIELVEKGMPSRKVGEIVGVGHMTVSRLRKEIIETCEKPKIGRPKNISERTENWMIRKVTSGKVDTATEL